MFFIVISCTTTTIEHKQHEIAAVDENSVIEKYSLPHKMLGENDGTTLIFSREKGLDTSYLFLLRSHKGRIRAVYYDINLKYHSDVYDFLDPTNELLYFEGFSFAVDSMQWKAVINKASNITGSYDDTSGEPCLHCGRYLLSWKGKLISGDQKKLQRLCFL